MEIGEGGRAMKEGKGGGVQGRECMCVCVCERERERIL